VGQAHTNPFKKRFAEGAKVGGGTRSRYQVWRFHGLRSPKRGLHPWLHPAAPLGPKSFHNADPPNPSPNEAL